MHVGTLRSRRSIYQGRQTSLTLSFFTEQFIDLATTATVLIAVVVEQCHVLVYLCCAFSACVARCDIHRLSLSLCVSALSGNQRPVPSLTHWFSHHFGNDDLQEVCRSALRETSLPLHPGLWLCLGKNHK